MVAGLLLVVTALVGNAHGDDLQTAQDRGLQLFRAGRYQEALPHFEKALDLAEAQRGPEDPSVAIDLNNLAETQRMLQHYDKAEQLYLRAIMIDEKGRGAADPGLATSLNNLALVYKAQNRLPEAERLFLRSLSSLERALGPNHLDVAKSLNNLAVLYRTEGQPDKARPLQQRAVAIAERTVGTQSAVTQMMKRNLAALGKPAGGTGPVAATAVPARPAPVPPKAAAAGPVRPGARAGSGTGPIGLGGPGRTRPDPPRPGRADAAGGDTGAKAPSAAGGFAIHLASIRDQAGIAAEWQATAKKYPSLAKLKPRPAQPIEIPGKGTFYRVEAGSFASRDEAAQACAPLKAAGAYCAIVAL